MLGNHTHEQSKPNITTRLWKSGHLHKLLIHLHIQIDRSYLKNYLEPFGTLSQALFWRPSMRLCHKKSIEHSDAKWTHTHPCSRYFYIKDDPLPLKALLMILGQDSSVKVAKKDGDHVLGCLSVLHVWRSSRLYEICI